MDVKYIIYCILNVDIIVFYEMVLSSKTENSIKDNEKENRDG
jgi:hypothetical protein